MRPQGDFQTALPWAGGSGDVEGQRRNSEPDAGLLDVTHESSLISSHLHLKFTKRLVWLMFYGNTEGAGFWVWLTSVPGSRTSCSRQRLKGSWTCWITVKTWEPELHEKYAWLSKGLRGPRGHLASIYICSIFWNLRPHNYKVQIDLITTLQKNNNNLHNKCVQYKKNNSGYLTLSKIKVL